MKFLKLVLIGCLFSFFFSSCEEEKIEASTIDKGFDYFPLAVGKFIIYKYDSIIYDNKGIDKFPFSGFIKEEIAEVISETPSETKYKVIKYWRKNATDLWQLTDVEAITKSSDKIIKTEENLPFIKLVFPNNNNATWRGNGLFDDNIEIKVYGEPMKIYQSWDYTIENKGSQLTFGELKFNETLEVLQTDNLRDSKSSIFNRRFSKEIFAKGIGMIQKEMRIYDSQKPLAGKPWEDYAEKGYSLIQTIVEHN
jgi:hypothetical protein